MTPDPTLSLALAFAACIPAGLAVGSLVTWRIAIKVQELEQAAACLDRASDRLDGAYTRTMLTKLYAGVR